MTGKQERDALAEITVRLERVEGAIAEICKALFGVGRSAQNPNVHAVIAGARSSQHV
jgi:hypothetical protein